MTRLRFLEALHVLCVVLTVCSVAQVHGHSHQRADSHNHGHAHEHHRGHRRVDSSDGSECTDKSAEKCMEVDQTVPARQYLAFREHLSSVLGSISRPAAAYLSSLATAMASLVGLIVLPLPPFVSAGIMTALLAFAAGALLADTALHLLPHAYEEFSHAAGYAILGGIAAFFALDRFVANFLHPSHSHGASFANKHIVSHRCCDEEKLDVNFRKEQRKHIDSAEDNNDWTKSDNLFVSEKEDVDEIRRKPRTRRRRRRSNTEYSSSASSASSSSMLPSQHREPSTSAVSAAYMNLAADALHNFCDGLTIGAAYKISTAAGISTTIAVILHEVPQELGDYMLLLRGGFSRRGALAANLLCGLASVVGTAASIYATTAFRRAPQIVLPFCAGGLLYMTIANVLPELGDAVLSHRQESTAATSMRAVCATLCGAAGVSVVHFIEGFTHDLG